MSPIPRFLWRCVAVAILFTSLGCSRAPRWNVLLITFDTTRADHIGAYGDTRARTPNTDALAREGTRFAHAYTAVPITAPSHSTILTGKYPLEHGFRDNGLFVLGDRHETLAEVLSANGWATAGAIASFPLLGRFGLSQGFDFYDDHITQVVENYSGERKDTGPSMFFDERPAGWVVDALEPWIEENHDEPFFAWAHFFDPHHPHRPPAPYDQLFADDLYRGEIAYADESLGQILAQLRRLEVLDRTLVVVTADHGEGNGEHNESTHSLLLYDTTLHVPLVIRVPGLGGGKLVTERVGTVDIVPTILDLLGLDAPEGIQGRSLAPAIRGDEAIDTRPLYAETLSPRLAQQWGELRALIDGRFKYVFGPRPELFDLDADPRELDDLVASEPERADRMQRQLARFLRENAADDVEQAVSLDEETRRRLMALGYIHSSAGEVEISEELRADGIPPQDRVGDVSAFSLARQMVLEQRGLHAREVVLGLLADDPDNPSYLDLLSRAELMLGRLDEARQTLDTLVRLYPGDPRTGQGLIQLAGYYHARGDLEQAADAVTRGLSQGPSAWGQHLLATIRADQQRPDDEWQALLAALEVEPDFAPARNDLAVRQAQAGDREAAEATFRETIARQPYYPRAHFNYGAFLAESERLDEAAQTFARAASLDPSYWQAFHAAAIIAATLGDTDAAAEYRDGLARIAASNPRAAAALADLGGATTP